MKTILVVTLALLLALSSFAQTQGTAIRATNGVAFGTLTVQGHILGTNTTETNFLAGGAVLTSGKYVGDGQGLTNLNYIERLNGKGTNISLYLNGSPPTIPIVLNTSQLQLYSGSGYPFGNSNYLTGAAIAEVQYNNAISNNGVARSGSFVGGLVNQSTNNQMIADQGSAVQSRLVEDNNLVLFAEGGSSIRGDINNSSNVVIQATSGSQISASTAAAINSQISASRAMLLAFPANNYTNGVTNAIAVVSSSGVSGINATGLFGNGSQITNLTPSGIGGPYVGVTGVAPYNVSNLWSVVLPDGATAFQLGNPGAGYASIFATNLIVTPDGLRYTIFTQGTNTLFGGDIYVTNGVYHGKSFRPQLVAATIVGATAQSTNLMELQDGSSNVLASVTASGIFTGNGAGLTNIAGSSVAGSGAGLTNISDISTNLTAGGERFLRTWGDATGGFQSLYIGHYAGNATPLLTNRNMAIGNSAGINFGTNTFDNTAIGDHALPLLVLGNRNSAISQHTLSLLTNGSYNSAGPGVGILEHLEKGDNNTGGGFYAGVWLDDTTNNTFFGAWSGSPANGAPANGSRNTGIGAYSQWRLSNGWANVTGGDGSGSWIISGRSNVFIGTDSGNPQNFEVTNAIAIGANASVTNSNAIKIGSLIESWNGTRLGLGTSNKAEIAKLDVISNGHEPQALFRGYSPVGGEAIYNGMIQVGWFSNEGIQLQYNTSTGIGYLDNLVPDDNSALIFRLKTFSTPVNAMTLKGTGNVGIGTISPAAKLDVAGNVAVSTTMTATNGTVLQMKTSFSTNYVIGSATNQQVFMVNTTNGLVTLPDASKSAGIVFRILSTNGFGSYTVTNATGTQTMRDGVSLSEKIVGIKPADFISDGASWFLVSKLRTVMPNAQFSTSTNIAFTSAATAYPISYDTTIRNNSQGIALTALTNGLNGRIYITNSGQYSIMFSAVQVSGHSTDKINIWLMQHGTNAPASATESVIGSANGQIPVTVEYIVDVGANPEYFELYGDASGTGCSLLANAASGYKPAMPSMIVTVKKISDPYP